MTNSSLMLSLLYVAIALMLLVLCLATSWKRWVKVLMIVLVTGSYFLATFTFEEMLGWPTPRMLPEKFAIVSAVIEEPNKERGLDGAIYLWITPLDSNRPSTVPRAYKLPYLKDNHSQLSEAQRKSRQGIRQIGVVERAGGGSGSAWYKVNVDNKIKLRVSDAPITRLPEK
jgi:hypothetical protein